MWDTIITWLGAFWDGFLWVLGKLWDLVLVVLDIYKGLLLAYPGISALIIVAAVVLYFALWGLYHKLRFEPSKVWQMPGVILIALAPIVSAIIGYLLNSCSET